MAQLVTSLCRALAVEQRPHLGHHGRAVGMLGIDGASQGTKLVAHDDTSSACPRVNPRSLATSASKLRNWRLPRCNRDITVPIGVSMISAISLYGKPSTSA